MSPSVVLGVLLGSSYGFLVHAFIGRGWRQLPLFWASAVVGFFGGYAVAVIGGGGVLNLGATPLLETTGGALLATSVVAAITRQGARRQTRGVTARRAAR